MLNPFIFDGDNFGIPHLIIYGKCDFPNCENTANQFCDDCNYVEQCSPCYQLILERSEIYKAFMDDAEKFTCIYCFVQLQHEELYNRNKTTDKSTCMYNDDDEPLR
jgi:hypothetical protein